MNISLDFSDSNFTLEFETLEKPSVEWEGREIKQLEFHSLKSLPQPHQPTHRKLCHGRQIGKLVLFSPLQFTSPIICSGFFKSLKKSANRVTNSIVETAKVVYAAGMRVLKTAAEVAKNAVATVGKTPNLNGGLVFNFVSEKVCTLSASFCEKHALPLGAKFVTYTAEKLKDAGEAVAHFIEKHKTEIIIGLIIVGTVVVAVALYYSGIGAGLSEGTVTAGLASANKLREEAKEEKQKKDSNSKHSSQTHNLVESNTSQDQQHTPPNTITVEPISFSDKYTLQSDTTTQIDHFDVDQLDLYSDQFDSKIVIVPLTDQLPELKDLSKKPPETPVYTPLTPGSSIQPNTYPVSSPTWIDQCLPPVNPSLGQPFPQPTASTPPTTYDTNDTPPPKEPEEKSNFASLATSGTYFENFDSPPPFEIVPLVGDKKMPCIQYECGINNTQETTLEGALCLHETLGGDFAVQGHQLHNDNLVGGLFLVQCEQVKQPNPQEACQGPTSPLLSESFVGPAIASTTLTNSYLQNSIAYTTENLSRTADLILAQNNPNLKQVHGAFSNGSYVMSEAVKNLTPEQRSTLVIITVGPTKIIENCMGATVINIVGKKDWASLSCIGGEKGIKNLSETSTIHLIDQFETEGFTGGHYFKQNEYQKEIKNTISQLKNNYEFF
ncbi:MAG: hypothetical protein JSS32_00495 [Verrucomicrobia bacterium]|nr:hypothetical protein [Verrucomicrobiota bacterium]